PTAILSTDASGAVVSNGVPSSGGAVNLGGGANTVPQVNNGAVPPIPNNIVPPGSSNTVPNLPASPTPMLLSTVAVARQPTPILNTASTINGSGIVANNLQPTPIIPQQNEPVQIPQQSEPLQVPPQGNPVQVPQVTSSATEISQVATPFFNPTGAAPQVPV